MLPRVLNKRDFKGFVEALMHGNAVAGPVAKENKFVFDEIERVDDLRMDYPITLLSPKKYFFPQYETLLRYRMGDAVQLEPVVPPAKRRLILGMHPCDMAATWLLDAVFEAKPGNPNYLSRRDRAVIIGLDCNKPCDEYQFCLDMGSLSRRDGADLFLTDLGDRYFVEVLTLSGKQLLDGATKAAVPAGAADFAARQEVEDQKAKAFRHKLPLDVKYLPEILDESYDSLIWEAIGRRCFSCGSCNTTCPTCYCFDVQDTLALDLATVSRERRWDSCQLVDFAEVAGGENFRHRRSDRLRHRFFRKGKYILEDHGRMGCVGCGRCDRVCVAKISSVELYNQIAGSR
ncbi:MAG TPA: 4Fe-4S dicluster domain-containing protein [Planctomycetota bacterium]|nr:4Fe-4S dicluster domain-containing protein [Planctomycetota bacterium]HRR79313.1 4Fe-4S dicluster domain-containing protein [Planctomycetota bacterium]HRT97624.1 4Fe-4S dicluster domain-containing protein [Planctomycetota bacterium]